MTKLMAPTPKQCELCSQVSLRTSLDSGLYPQFLGTEAPVENHDPGDACTQ